MADRKVLNKYFPKNFDHERIVKRGRGKQKLMIVRNMLPMSLRCNTCSNYLYIGTKFNMRMEICNDQVYLGIKVFRFYLKCTYCYADITFKTDPKNHDYVVQTGGTRNYEAIKDAQQAEKTMKKMKVNQKQGDSMKYLQSKTYDSKREMELTETLQDIKSLNKRQGVIDPEDLLKNIIYLEEEEEKMNEQQELQIDNRWNQLCQQNMQRRLKQLQKNTKQQKPKNNKNRLNLTIHEENQQSEDQDGQNYQIKNKNGTNAEQNVEYSAVKQDRPSENRFNESIQDQIPVKNKIQKQTTGKKVIMPIAKTKLDKYKMKIIKKQPKPQQKKLTPIQICNPNQ